MPYLDDEPWQRDAAYDGDGSSDDTAWRGDLHPEAGSGRPRWDGPEERMYREQAEQDEALKKLLGDVRIIDDPDTQC